LRSQGGEPAPMTPDEFAQFIQQESVQYKKIVEQAHISAGN
jgi:tripartite-type tricarboxylate transporter receptor subunit TctC